MPSGSSANQVNSGYFPYNASLANYSSNSNGLFNVLKFQPTHQSPHIQTIGQNLSDSGTMELQGLSVLAANSNGLSRKTDGNAISVQQLSFNQLAASGRNYSKKPLNPSKTGGYQSNNSSLVKFANDGDGGLARPHCPPFKRQLSSSELKVKDVSLPTVS